MPYERGELEAITRRARPGDEETILTPCVAPPPEGVEPGAWQAAVRARREWLHHGLASGRLRVMLALVPAQEGPLMEYPGVGRVPVASLAHDGLIPAGIIEYAPLAHAAEPVRGGDHWIIHCMWVIPPFARRGVGSALLTAAVRDLREDPEVAPEAGLAVVAYRGEQWWGFFDYMPEAFFARHGFRPVDRDGSRVLMYRPVAATPMDLFERCDEPPGAGQPLYLIPPRQNLEGTGVPGTIPLPGEEAGAARPQGTHVRFLYHSRCPAAAAVWERLKAEAGSRPGLHLEAVDTRDPGAMRWYGVANGLFVNGRLVLHKVPSPGEVRAAAGIGP
ncbi:GNAT family N-acetyltransferase [Limnochorda pilosa]|uniref:N-acetyltransferase domain-containing protein n=1 Tax=Limnochorda pilosa TaxID=1555112 RepID=A0A0K2SMF1_LIMPI|nr:GNAT family N-acetyltransferase [Limnochorda pilosa]BAS28308.1 hypothetical protein LIP_2467 [Limnochorda pilosa]